MAWIKISDDLGGVYAEEIESPGVITSIDELDRQIADQEQMKANMVLVPYPDGASPEVREAIDQFNTPAQSEIYQADIQIRGLKAKKTELLNI